MQRLGGLEGGAETAVLLETAAQTVDDLRGRLNRAESRLAESSAESPAPTAEDPLPARREPEVEALKTRLTAAEKAAQRTWSRSRD